MTRVKPKFMDLNEIAYRDDPCLTDANQVRAIVISSGFFSEDEIAVAVELVEERL